MADHPFDADLARRLLGALVVAVTTVLVILILPAAPTGWRLATAAALVLVGILAIWPAASGSSLPVPARVLGGVLAACGCVLFFVWSDGTGHPVAEQAPPSTAPDKDTVDVPSVEAHAAGTCWFVPLGDPVAPDGHRSSQSTSERRNALEMLVGDDRSNQSQVIDALARLDLEAGDRAGFHDRYIELIEDATTAQPLIYYAKALLDNGLTADSRVGSAAREPIGVAALATERFPRDARALAFAAYLRSVETGEPVESIAGFRRAIELAPDDGVVRYFAGYWGYDEAAQYEAALYEVQQAVELRPDCRGHWEALTFIVRHRPLDITDDQKVDLLRAGLRQSPYPETLAESIAALLIDEGNLGQSIADWSALGGEHPNFALVVPWLTAAGGRPLDAAVHLEQLARETDRTDEFRSQIADWLVEAGELDAALRRFDGVAVDELSCEDVSPYIVATALQAGSAWTHESLTVEVSDACIASAAAEAARRSPTANLPQPGEDELALLESAAALDNSTRAWYDYGDRLIDADQSVQGRLALLESLDASPIEHYPYAQSLARLIPLVAGTDLEQTDEQLRSRLAPLNGLDAHDAARRIAASGLAAIDRHDLVVELLEADEDPESTFMVGDGLAALGQTDAATERFREAAAGFRLALEDRPDDKYLADGLAESLARAGDNAAARREFDTLIDEADRFDLTDEDKRYYLSWLTDLATRLEDRDAAASYEAQREALTSRTAASPP